VVAEACWWARETVSVNHAIIPVPIKRYPSRKETERDPGDGQREGQPVKERSDGAEWRWAIARNSLKRSRFPPPLLPPSAPPPPRPPPLNPSCPKPETGATSETPLNSPAKALSRTFLADPSSERRSCLLPSFLPSSMKGFGRPPRPREWTDCLARN